MTVYLFLILFIYILKEAFELLIGHLNLRHMRKCGVSIPPEFEGKVDEGLLKKTIDYEAEKARFGFVSSLFGSVVTIALIFCGVLNIYSSWIASLNLSFIFSGWLFFALLFFGGEILSMPFGIYSTFVIENKYGFNTMTCRLWMSDFIKSLAISAVILSLVVLAGLWLVGRSPHLWWFCVWGFLFFLSIFIMYISPYVIEPLFNKFTPVDDESLREKIRAVAEKAGIHVGRILKIDASRRSRHTNAYFTGIGRTKRIVLYDTLLKDMNPDEVISILAHEIGHWKRKHLLKTIAIFELVSLAALYASYRLMGGNFLNVLFRLDHPTFYAKVILLAFLGGIIALPFSPLMNSFSRRHEREADRISYELTGDASSMASAFVKLSKENLSNLYPHPLYVSFYYSHPPILERIRYVKEMEVK